MIVDEAGKNARALLCEYCGTKIINSGVASFIEKTVKLPRPSRGDPVEIVESFWDVSDQDHFLNIGASRPVDQSIRYLLCSECDWGPLGINYLNENATHFYLATSRVLSESLAEDDEAPQ